MLKQSTFWTILGFISCVFAQTQVLAQATPSDSLEAVITVRSRQSLPVDSLLDVYITTLPIDSGKSLRVLRFLALQAPVLNSYANELLRQNPVLFKTVWASLPLDQRIRINNQVIAKTWQKAVADQDPEEAKLAATFAGNTNRTPTAQVRAFQGVMLEYYFGMKDTLKYLTLAGTYYDTYLMCFNADSLKTEDSLHHRVGDLSVCRFLGTQLKTGADRTYALTTDAVLRRQAALWAKRAAVLML